MTAAEALADYVAYLRAHCATGNEIEGRVRKHILPTLGAIRVSDLTKQHIEQWQQNMVAVGDDETVRKSKVTANKMLQALRAALNRVPKISEKPWREVKQFRKVNAARPRYCEIDDARKLLDAAAPDFHLLLQAGLHTGARYSELARAKVQDFKDGNLHIPMSKSGAVRDIILTTEGRAFFAGLCAGKKRDDLIFIKDNGEPWRKSNQREPMIATCNAAGLDYINFHNATRHTRASLSVMNGMPLTVVAKNLGHADLRQTTRHYVHLSPDYVDKAIERSAPRYGIGGPLKRAG